MGEAAEIGGAGRPAACEDTRRATGSHAVAGDGAGRRDRPAVPDARAAGRVRSLRWGELMGLRKTDFDLPVGLVQVERSVSLVGVRQLIKQPKTSRVSGRSCCRCGCFPTWNGTSRTTPSRRRRSDVHRPEGRHAGRSELLCHLGVGAGEGRHDRRPGPRPAARQVAEFDLSLGHDLHVTRHPTS